MAQETLRFFGVGGVGGRARPDGSAEVALVEAEEVVVVGGAILQGASTVETSLWLSLC